MFMILCYIIFILLHCMRCYDKQDKCDLILESACKPISDTVNYNPCRKTYPGCKECKKSIEDVLIFIGSLQSLAPYIIKEPLETLYVEVLKTSGGLTNITDEIFQSLSSNLSDNIINSFNQMSLNLDTEILAELNSLKQSIDSSAALISTEYNSYITNLLSRSNADIALQIRDSIYGMVPQLESLIAAFKQEVMGLLQTTDTNIQALIASPIFSTSYTQMKTEINGLIDRFVVDLLGSLDNNSGSLETIITQTRLDLYQNIEYTCIKYFEMIDVIFSKCLSAIFKKTQLKAPDVPIK